jgi:hypothetical protein
MLTPNGGVFGRNPKFQNVTVENNLTVNGDFTLGDDIVINDTLLVNGVATFRGGIISIPNSAAPTSNTVLGLLAGNALASGAVQNVLIGSDAGKSISNADFNVAVGGQALRGFDAALNTAVGYNAMGAFASGNTGALNTAVGYNAGASLRAGGTNVAVGNDAGSTNQNANNTVAVGAQAALLNTASDITAVGANALDANTTGTNNTAVGKDALGGCTTGSSNTALGHGALDAITTQGSNTAIGTNALGSACDQFNTAVGAEALAANTSNLNVAVGYLALGNTAAASGNTAIGTNAGRFRGTGTDALATGSNSVFVGYNSRASADGQSNQIVIGHDALGNGSNTTTIGNSSTTNTFIAGGDLRVVGGIRAVNAANPTFTPPSGHSAAFYVPTGIGTLTDAVVVGNANQSATLRMTHNGASAIQCSFGRLSPSGTFDEHLRVTGTTAASSVTSVFGTAASTSTSTGALVVSGGVGVAGAIYPGDNIVMASGKGIDFSATANSSGTMTSELLSDYEEGTFTPTVSSGVTSPTYTTQLGWYTKIGRVVIAHVDIQLSGGTANANRFQFGGLPFTSFNSIGLGRSGGYWIFGGGVRANDTDALPALYMPSNSTEVQLFTQLAVSYAGTSFNSITQVMRFVVIYNT